MRELTLDPVYHLREAKECPAFLMVFEKYTGTIVSVFINDVYEFAIQMTETSMRELTLDPVYHLREAKECPAFLMVFEKYTGTV